MENTQFNFFFTAFLNLPCVLMLFSQRLPWFRMSQCKLLVNILMKIENDYFRNCDIIDNVTGSFIIRGDTSVCPTLNFFHGSFLF